MSKSGSTREADAQAAQARAATQVQADADRETADREVSEREAAQAQEAALSETSAEPVMRSTGVPAGDVPVAPTVTQRLGGEVPVGTSVAGVPRRGGEVPPGGVYPPGSEPYQDRDSRFYSGAGKNYQDPAVSGLPGEPGLSGQEVERKETVITQTGAAAQRGGLNLADAAASLAKVAQHHAACSLGATGLCSCAVGPALDAVKAAIGEAR